jgi:N6-L-threonylcarbamoyladenine synthase
MSLILGIESSCDETAASVVADGSNVLSNCISSQIAEHAPYGGVVPELAAREHLKNIQPVVFQALKDADVSVQDLDAVAVTNGPGLLPALVIGVNFAKALAYINNKPIIGINHFLAHIYGAFLEDNVSLLKEKTSFPIAALVVSGGHTAIVVIQSDGKAEIIGSTIDDAAGEAFDKAAKLLGLGYPGGPVIEKTAQLGNASAFNFPRPLTGAAGKALKSAHKYDFSFSGLKTSLLYHCRNLGLIESDANMTGNISVCSNNSSAQLYDTVASYQEAIIDVLSAKFYNAVREFEASTAVLCGGVACNGVLRSRVLELIQGKLNRNVIIAPPVYCTDNAAMVAALGERYFNSGIVDDEYLDVFTRLESTELSVPFSCL